MSKSALSVLIIGTILGSVLNLAQAASSSQKAKTLEQRFERQLRAFLLTTPAANNASDTLKELATEHPDHPLIKQGPIRIADRYMLLAEKSFKKDKDQSAFKYIDKALLFYPQSKQTEDLRQHLTKKRQESFGGLGNGIVAITGGCFEMGSSSFQIEQSSVQRSHKICVKDFGMAKHEVTYAEFDRYSLATGQPLIDDKGWGRGKRPVVGVSWRQANDYAEWLSKTTSQRYRLPTEAEWEYAAKAGSNNPFHTGEKMSRRQGNINPDNKNYSPRGKTQPVGKYSANGWGLYDVHGNVWEWTCSVYQPLEQIAKEQQCSEHTNNAERILRGGSWYSRPAQTHVTARATKPYIDNNLGFRIVQNFH